MYRSICLQLSRFFRSIQGPTPRKRTRTVLTVESLEERCTPTTTYTGGSYYDPLLHRRNPASPPRQAPVPGNPTTPIDGTVTGGGGIGLGDNTSNGGPFGILPGTGGGSGGSGDFDGPSAAPLGYYATGAGPGSSTVNVYNTATGKVVASFAAFPGFVGGVRVAVGDVNGDGTPDIVCGAGPGGGPEVKVFDGKTFQVIHDYQALTPTFTGGVFVACGDVNGDGYADIITSADAGGGPQVTVTSGRDLRMLSSFFATAESFTGGIRVAADDINGDGHADVIAAAGPGGGPQVTIFDGRTLSRVTAFYALTPTFNGGLFVTAGNISRNGREDIIVGADKGGGPQVAVFDALTQQQLGSFYALPSGFTGGVRVGVVQSPSGGVLLATAGAGASPEVSAFDGVSLKALAGFYAYDPSFAGGVFIGG